jgi:hypothetical protein
VSFLKDAAGNTDGDICFKKKLLKLRRRESSASHRAVTYISDLVAKV